MTKVRRNPHQEKNLRRRRSLGADRARQTAITTVDEKNSSDGADTSPRSQRAVDASAQYVAVVFDNLPEVSNSLESSVFGLAQRLANESASAVTAIPLTRNDADLGLAGADRVFRFCGDIQPDGIAEFIADDIMLGNCHGIVYLEAHEVSADVARRVAAMLPMSISTDVVAIQLEDGMCRSRRGAYEFIERLGSIIGIHPESDVVFSSEPGEAHTMLKSQENRDQSLKFIGTSKVNPRDLPLVEADFIISAGAGIKDLDSFLVLAETIGASPAGSRVVCDRGGLSRDCQVGATGVSVSPRVYVAFGISGAPQHLEGIRDCEYVISVNVDRSCPMVSRADMVVVGDADTTIQEMLNAARESKVAKEDKP